MGQEAVSGHEAGQPGKVGERRIRGEEENPGGGRLNEEISPHQVAAEHGPGDLRYHRLFFTRLGVIEPRQKTGPKTSSSAARPSTGA